MLNRVFLHFLALSIFGEKSRHIATVLLSILILFLLSSVLFISSSTQTTLKKAMQNEADLVVQRVVAGRIATVPIEWEREILDIRGVEKVTPRVWGRYFDKEKGKSFLIIGIDFLDESANRAFEKLIDGIDLKSFLKKHNMIVSTAVKRWMKRHFYNKNYNFISPKGDFIQMDIYATLPKDIDIFANDVIIMDIEDARRVFAIGEDRATDLILNIPNDSEKPYIQDKISSLHYDIRTISKKESLSAYDRLFNFKGGFFLSLFLIVLMTFVLILYQRYNQTYSTQKRQIGIYRALGWSIGDVLKLKLLESLSIVIGSYIIGVSLAYIFVYIYQAPLLKSIFFGNGNLDLEVVFVPVIDFSALSSIFLLYAIPFMASVLIPVWRIASSEPKEAMR